MNVDVVTSDEGYFALYLDGRLEYWGCDEPFAVLAENLEGKTVDGFNAHTLGLFGIGATQYEEPPDWVGDIPTRWWTDDRYVDGCEED